MSSLITAISFARESNVWDKNEYTLDVQVEANAANAQRDGLQISHSFREKFSGTNLWAMPELTRLRSLLQATPGRKIVYVYAQDRLVRGLDSRPLGRDSLCPYRAALVSTVRRPFQWLQ